MYYYSSGTVNNIDYIQTHVRNVNRMSGLFLFYPHAKKVLCELNPAIICLFFLLYRRASSCAFWVKSDAIPLFLLNYLPL